MAEAVVDGLEVVEVHEDDSELAVLPPGASHGMPHPLAEQRPVGQVGHRVVEGLVGELLLERLALADVAAVEDDAADVLVVEQIRVEDLELADAPVAVAQRALQHPRLRAGRPVGEHVQQPALLARLEQALEPGSHHVLGRVPEHPQDRRALVDDRRVRVEHRDQVAGVLDEGGEARLSGTAVDLLHQRGALERQGHLGRERGQAPAQGARLALDPEHEHAVGLAADGEVQGVQVTVGEAQLLPATHRVRGQGGQRPGRRAGSRDQHMVVLDQAEPGIGLDAAEEAGRVKRGTADLLAVGRPDQIGAGRAQDALALDRSLLLADQAGHPGHDQSEEEYGGDVDDAPILGVHRGSGRTRSPVP